MGQALHTLGIDSMSVEVRIELDRRLAEDDTAPGDTISWETLKAESQARWQPLSGRNGISHA